VATFPDAGSAAIARASLDAEGIMAWVQGAEASAMMGYVGSALGGVRLQVAAEEAKRAATILHDAAGDGTPSDHAGGPWICGPCGERIDAGFDVCWMCGADRGDTGPASDEVSRAPVTDEELERLSVADGEAEPDGVAVAAAATDWDEMADRAWRATLIGVVCPPVMIYGGFLLTQVLGRELQPGRKWRVLAATTIFLLYVTLVLWLASDPWD
jgi:hypothetical protein